MREGDSGAVGLAGSLIRKGIKITRNEALGRGKIGAQACNKRR